MGNLIDEHQAANYLGLSVHTLRRWRLFRQGPSFIKVGNKAVRYRVADLEAFLAEGISPNRKGA